MHEHGMEALTGKPTPSVKDNRKTKYTYLFICGERWVEKLNLSSSMSKFCCITDLIQFMIKEGYKLMKGSVHEDDFFIVHDDLVLMTVNNRITHERERKSISVVACYP